MKYVNILGEEVDTSPVKIKKTKAVGDVKAFHKGFSVEGIPPGVIEEARAKLGDEFNENVFYGSAKTKKVRAKPYELEDAAHECKALAEKAGWLRVTVNAKSKGQA